MRSQSREGFSPNARRLWAKAQAAFLASLLLAPEVFADTLLWRIGQADNSSHEFTGHGVPATFEIPAGWAARKTWPEWPTQSGPPDLFTSDISFNVTTIPPNAGRLTDRL